MLFFITSFHLNSLKSNLGFSYLSYPLSSAFSSWCNEWYFPSNLAFLTRGPFETGTKGFESAGISPGEVHPWLVSMIPSPDRVLRLALRFPYNCWVWVWSIWWRKVCCLKSSTPTTDARLSLFFFFLFAILCIQMCLWIRVKVCVREL